VKRWLGIILLLILLLVSGAAFSGKFLVVNQLQETMICSSFVAIRMAQVVFTRGFGGEGFDLLRLRNIIQLVQPSQNLGPLFLAALSRVTTRSYPWEQFLQEHWGRYSS